MTMSNRFLTTAVIGGALLLCGCGDDAKSAALANDAAPAAAAPAGPAQSVGALPAPTHSVAGRVATVTLPYRSADRLIWVSASKMSETAPFVFKGIEIKPGAGPNGTDLAVFSYEADHAGTATLKFGLVPPGKMLIGLPTMVYAGPVSARYEATVTAQ